MPEVANFVPANTIGLLYLTDETTDNYRMTLRFPGIKNASTDSLLRAHFGNDHSGENYTKDVTMVTTPLSVTFFDELGQTIIIDSLSRLHLRFQCENDGPLIIDPVYDILLPKTAYPGRPSPKLTTYTGAIFGAGVADYQADKLKPAGAIDYIPGELAFEVKPPGFVAPLISIFLELEESDEYGGEPCWYYRAINRDRLMEINCCGP